MNKKAMICILLAFAAVFFSCGGNSSSNDDGGFTAPDLNPEKYPEVDVMTDEYAAAETMLKEIVNIYITASDSDSGSGVSKQLLGEIGKYICKTSIQRSSPSTHTYDLSYSGKGFTVSGTDIVNYSGEDIYPCSYHGDMTVVFNNYESTSSKVSFVCNGTMRYQTKGSWQTKYTGEGTDYTSAELTVEINGVTYSIEIEEVQVNSETNGTEAYNVKKVYTFNGTKYGTMFEGTNVEDEKK